MPDVAYSVARDEQLDFHSHEVICSWSAVFANSHSQISKLSDLNGKRIAALKGSVQEEVLQQMLKGFGYDAVIVDVESYEEAFSLASAGAVDAVVVNYQFGDYFYRKYGLKKTDMVFNPVSLHFAAYMTVKPMKSELHIQKYTA